MVDAEFVSLADFLRTRQPRLESASSLRGPASISPLVAPLGENRPSCEPLGAGLPPTVGVAQSSLPDPAANDALPPPPLSPSLAQGSTDGAGCVCVASGMRIEAYGETPEATAAIREAKLFRAALADAFDELAARLTHDLAATVLGRELRLAPVDIETIARHLIEERCTEEPLRLHVAPGDAHIVCEIPIVPDERLQRGDAILACRSGDIDARMRVRLMGALESNDR